MLDTANPGQILPDGPAEGQRDRRRLRPPFGWRHRTAQGVFDQLDDCGGHPEWPRPSVPSPLTSDLLFPMSGLWALDFRNGLNPATTQTTSVCGGSSSLRAWAVDWASWTEDGLWNEDYLHAAVVRP